MLSGITDTHALVWYASGASNKLGVAARRIFEAADRKDGSGMVIIPTVVLHEISSLLIAEKISLERIWQTGLDLLKNTGFFKLWMSAPRWCCVRTTSKTSSILLIA
jgi:PIN domain nuclease of toxin-antitoxin system